MRFGPWRAVKQVLAPAELPDSRGESVRAGRPRCRTRRSERLTCVMHQCEIFFETWQMQKRVCPWSFSPRHRQLEPFLGHKWGLLERRWFTHCAHIHKSDTSTTPVPTFPSPPPKNSRNLLAPILVAEHMKILRPHANTDLETLLGSSQVEEWGCGRTHTLRRSPVYLQLVLPEPPGCIPHSVS